MKYYKAEFLFNSQYGDYKRACLIDSDCHLSPRDLREVAMNENMCHGSVLLWRKELTWLEYHQELVMLKMQKEREEAEELLDKAYEEWKNRFYQDVVNKPQLNQITRNGDGSVTFKYDNDTHMNLPSDTLYEVLSNHLGTFKSVPNYAYICDK